MQFSVYQQSHIGGRKVNQDRMGYSYTREALLLVLADGMGGHQRGEVAASIALQTMSTLFRSQATPYVKKPERFLEDAFEQAHEAIQRYAREHGMPDNPRTTIVACLVQHNCAVWAHCGDSRLYWLRRGQILARTRDHSHIEHLIAKGLADPSERGTHPDRNKLYSCLGASTPPKVELSRQSSLEPGDVLLLCSDGLWGILPDTEIVHQLSTHTIVQAVPDMIGMATAIAGPRGDNTTALAIQWQGAHDAPSSGDEGMVSTLMLPEGEVTTRLAEEPAASPVDDFGDEDIEKAIAEIRDAIEKSSQLLK
ncbi:Serine/threonine phosphatase stp [Massilia sp. Bi118]|uniref:PP2C family protein-serine/threonine phosphatase n=1 Tax=Massilia sp. Bi118 TaxID=2822346 RepID=UPI001DB40124|nr:PP2C family serine/threonine-protein phosphatase [Massilia sp. Bi118]CAH0298601.1 Serine/threonine phosphatase stp [Massilia sp. Bi118]